METACEHAPVLLSEVLAFLDPKDGDILVDGTFGRGGYSQALLNRANASVWAVDRDPEAVQRGREMEREYAPYFTFVSGRFGDLRSLLVQYGLEAVDGVVLDLGVSSPQLDQPSRGFSFQKEGPLDMRMEQKGMTAAQVVNTLGEKEIADLIYTLGEERFSRRIARKIVEVRLHHPLKTTEQLARLVREAVPRSKDGLDPATRTFQALRLYVNDEMGELQRGLEHAEHLLKPGGRLVVVSFHSLEDRCVKHFLRDRAKSTQGPIGRYAPPAPDATLSPTFEILTRKAVRPSSEECRQNPRARSAKLRAARRLPSSALFAKGDF